MPKTKLLTLALAAAMSGALCAPQAVAAAQPAAIDIPYEQFTLPNGLRVVVHTDRKAPVRALKLGEVQVIDAEGKPARD